MIELHVIAEKLSDGSAVYRLVIHDSEMPNSECVSIDCIGEGDAIRLQEKIAYAIEEHTNETAECM